MLELSGIHVYFVLKELWHNLTSHLCDCPHCQSVRSARGSTLLPVSNEYTPLQSDSTEDAEIRDVEAGN